MHEHTQPTRSILRSTLRLAIAGIAVMAALGQIKTAVADTSDNPPVNVPAPNCPAVSGASLVKRVVPTSDNGSLVTMACTYSDSVSGGSQAIDIFWANKDGANPETDSVVLQGACGTSLTPRPGMAEQRGSNNSWAAYWIIGNQSFSSNDVARYSAAGRQMLATLSQYARPCATSPTSQAADTAAPSANPVNVASIPPSTSSSDTGAIAAGAVAVVLVAGAAAVAIRRIRKPAGYDPIAGLSAQPVSGGVTPEPATPPPDTTPTPPSPATDDSPIGNQTIEQMMDADPLTEKDLEP